MGNKLKGAVRITLAKLVLSALFGILGGVLTIGLVALLDKLIDIIWSDWLGYNVDDPSRGIMPLIMLLIVGLIVGLLAKKFGPSKGSIESVIEDTLEKGVTDWRIAFKDVGIGILSIGSGASLGPEAPAAMLNGGIASFIAEKRKLSKSLSEVLNISAVSGLLGSLLSSPFVATAMFVEFSSNKLSELKSTISYTFVAGSFGIATFFWLLNKTSAEGFGIPALQGPPTDADLFMAFVFGFIGAVFTLIVGIVMQTAEPLFKRLDKNIVLKSVIGGLIAGVIAVILPITMFSGQNTITNLIEDSATLGAGVLFLIALAKLVATSTLIRTGFFGGPIFPAIFAGVALGLAINTIFNITEAVAIAATISGILAVSLRKPLSAAVLAVAITGIANATIVALAVSAGLVIVYLIEQVNKQAQINK